MDPGRSIDARRAPRKPVAAPGPAVAADHAPGPGLIELALHDQTRIGAPAVGSLQMSAGNRAIADLIAGWGPGTRMRAESPPVQRQPAPRNDPWRRQGEAWAYGPITTRKSVTHDLVTYIGWIKDVEQGYGPDKQMVLQRLRRMYYSSYSGKAGSKFDRVIAPQAGAGDEPLTIPQAPAAAVDGLYETDNVVTPDGQTLDPGHILAALDLKTSGLTWKAEGAEVAIGTTMLGVVTWAGDLASWWLEWTQQLKKIHEAPRPEPTGPATEEGPPDEVGGDPALAIALWEQIGRSKVSKEDLLGDMDAQVLAASSTQKSTPESIKREKRMVMYKNIDTELTAPVSKLLEAYYGVGAKKGTTAPSKNQFASFVRTASPPIPYQEVEEGNASRIALASDAEESIRKSVENVAWMFVSQGGSGETSSKDKDPDAMLRNYGWRIKDIAKRFADFLQTGLKNGDAAWL